MDLPVPPASAPAPTPTRACQSCAIAKSKCVPQPGTTSGACSRCCRLKRTCSPAPSAIRKRKPPRQTRTAKLEEKIENLVALLSNSSKAPPSSESTQQAEEAQESQTASPSSSTPVGPGISIIDISNDGTYVEPVREQLETVTDAVAPPTSDLQSNNQLTPDLSPSIEISPTEAASVLNIFRTNYVHSFPFVVIPHDMSPEELKHRKPHLYRSIMMVASYHTPLRQMSMGKEILQSFSTNLIFEGEKSLDLLQALLVYTSWHFFHFSIKPRITSLLQLAMGLMFDLRLNTVHHNEGDEVFCYERPIRNTGEAMRDDNTSDEQRAYLGVWYLASTISLCYKRVDGPRYSSRIEYCCNSLSASAEYSSDIFAVATVRLQCIAERLQDVFMSRDSQQRNQVTAPIGMHVKLFQNEMSEFKSSLPTNIQEDIFLVTQYYILESYLYEISISQLSDKSYGTYPFQRLDMLYACVTACQNFFTSYFAIPVCDYTSCSFLVSARLSLALVTVFKLSLLRAPGWDSQYVRQQINLLAYIDRLAEKFQEAVSYADAKGEMKKTDGFSRCVWKLRRAKVWYEAKLRADAGLDRPLETPNALQANDFGFENLDPFDESYWQQFLGDWDSAIC